MSWPGHRHNLRCWSLLTLLTRCQVICCSVTVSHVTTAVYGGMRYGLNPEQPEYALVSSSRLMCCWGFVCSFILYGTPSVLHFQLNGRRTYEQFDSDSPVTKYLRLSQQVRSSGFESQHGASLKMVWRQFRFLSFVHSIDEISNPSTNPSLCYLDYGIIMTKM